MCSAKKDVALVASTMRQAGTSAIVEITSPCTTAVIRTQLLWITMRTNFKVRILALRTVNTLIPNVAKAGTRSAVAVTKLSGRTIVITIRKWTNHVWTCLSRWYTFIKQFLIWCFEGSFVDSFSLVVGGITIHTYKAGVIGLGVGAIGISWTWLQDTKWSCFM